MTLLPDPSGPPPGQPGNGKRHRGEIKWFDTRRGFGFILTNNGWDVFVHYSSIRQDGFRSLCDGAVVEYTASQGEKGWYADDVVVVESESPSTKTALSDDGDSPAAPATID